MKAITLTLRVAVGKRHEGQMVWPSITAVRRRCNGPITVSLDWTETDGSIARRGGTYTTAHAGREAIFEAEKWLSEAGVTLDGQGIW